MSEVLWLNKETLEERYLDEFSVFPYRSSWVKVPEGTTFATGDKDNFVFRKDGWYYEDGEWVESILDDINYQSKHSNQPYSEPELNRYWWWYVSGWINATRSKMSETENHIFRVKFFDEVEIELSGKDFTEYCNARKNVDVEYIDVLYHRGRFNSKGGVKKFLCDELELNDGEVNSGGWF